MQRVPLANYWSGQEVTAVFADVDRDSQNITTGTIAAVLTEAMRDAAG